MFTRQYAKNGNWLFQDQENGRIFTDYVILPSGASVWPECTNDEKEQWEREHAPAVPEPLNDK